MKERSGVQLHRYENLKRAVSMLGSRTALIDRVPKLTSAHLTQMLSTGAGGRGIGDKIARRIEKALGKQPGDMDLPDWGQTIPASLRNKAPKNGGRLIKLVADYDGTDMKPRSRADRIEFNCDDPGAFAIQITGDWGFPRLRHGEVVVIEPNAPSQSGDVVLIELSDGTRSLGILNAFKPDHVSVHAVHKESAPQTFMAKKVKSISPAAAILLRPKIHAT